MSPLIFLIVMINANDHQESEGRHTKRRPAILLSPGHGLLSMNTFPNFLDHFTVKGRQVLGISAGNQALVGNYLLVNPLGAGIPQVRLQ